MSFAAPKDEHTGDLFDLAFAIGGAAVFGYACWNDRLLLAFVGAVVAVVFYGQWKRWPWASWALLGLTALALLTEAWLISTRGLTPLRGVVVACCLVFLWTRWRELRRTRLSAESDKNKPMISLALWQKASRPLDDRILAEIVTSAWGGDFSGKHDGAAEFVVGNSPLFMVKTTHGMFVVHHVDRSYFEDPEKAVESLTELRCRKAAAEHRAWLAVDWMGPIPAPDADPSREEIYRLIGKLVAELGDHNTLALVHPETNRVYPWTAELEEDLRDGQGLGAVAVSALAPVIPIQAGDADMAEATAEARRRWPEFVAKFSKRHPEQTFAVKAPISAGGSIEHIWIDVERIGPDAIHGRLGNEPVDLGNLSIGDPVTVPLDEIEDWVYVLTNTPVGAFTADVVRRAAD